jgi:trehalose/maltose hydrolase-like predicted phosphorylase
VAVNDPTWVVLEKGFDQKRQAWRESLFSLGNGYMGVRGSVEENDLPFPDSRPGVFVSGVFDIYADWYQAIVNLPYYFTTRFTLGGEVFSMTRGKVKNYVRTLDMYRGLLTRTFVWQDAKGRETEFKFERLVSMAELHLAALRVAIKPLNWSGAVTVDNILDAEVDNIDFHKSGYQLRKERYYFVDFETSGALGENSATLQVKTKTNPHQVAQAIRVALSSEGKKVAAKTVLAKDGKQVSRRLSFAAAKGKAYTLDKMVGVAASRDRLPGNLVQVADKFAAQALSRGFEKVLADHAAAWCGRWRAGDIVIQGHAGDQQATRFSIFHLTQFVNPNDNRVNIGSRGLTAEMHYGNCFWDTELFIIPYYIYTWPQAARALMEYRYQTLPEARNKAKRLFFKGAMFPWMSSFPGKEQADYWEYANIAVHIVGDIHYALEHYRNASGDEEFVEKYGAEIILETARFWQSRCHYSAARKKYIMVTVKGPNEYDGVINNNTYTNWGARYNLLSAVKLARKLKKEKPAVWKSLSAKLKLTEPEISAWEKTGNGMFINYDAKRKLFIEDDQFLDKAPFNMKELKPGKQIITERGVSWDTLLRLQIVKQADVLLMMSLFPDAFTREQVKNAWDFYEPKTCHDSSLSPCTHAMIAAQLDMPQEAMNYWDQNARLDLDDLMDNSFLGVHSACVGGTWQIVVLGFAGMRLRENGFAFQPRVPKRWKGIGFSLHHKNRVLQVSMDHKQCSFTLTPGAKSAVSVTLGNKTYAIKPGQTVKVAYKN